MIVSETTAARSTEPVYLTLMIACLNEDRNVVATLTTVTEALSRFDFTWEVIVIDDGSTDETVAVARRYLDDHNDLPLRLVSNATNEGLAQTYITGAFLGRGEFYRLVCGDNVEPVQTLVDVIGQIGRADIVVPYYPAAGARSPLRRTLSSTYTTLINAISGYRLRYYNGLPVLRRYDVMRWHTNYHGFGFQADMLVRLLDQGRSFVEVPVTVTERRQGQSSALRVKNLLSVGHTLMDLLIRRIGRELYPERRKGPALDGRSSPSSLTKDAT